MNQVTTMSNGTNFNTLDVVIGKNRKIATVSVVVGSEIDLSLHYESDWISDGFPISPHLPFNTTFGSLEVRNYLQNLLPEGSGLEDIVTDTTISKNNTFGLIKKIGKETSGALSFRAKVGDVTESSFREIPDSEMIDRLLRLKSTGESITYWDGKTRLSVAGVQDKLNILEMNGKIGFGEGELCSNKIFKFETSKAPLIGVNEYFTLILANLSGLQIPEVELRSYGEVRTLVIDRFDRRLMNDQTSVLRRHVIDGCQAVNLPPSYKYERQHGDDGDGIYIRDGVSFSKLFSIETVNDEAYHSQLIKWMTFNILVRNYDAHGKNISFFVGKQGLEISPFYDLVNIEAMVRTNHNKMNDGSERISQTYAMSIGDTESGSSGNFENPYTAYMFADFANEFNISLPRMTLLMGNTIKQVLSSINEAKQSAIQQGLSSDEIKHVDLCIAVIQEAATDLQIEVSNITSMKDLI